VSSERFVVKALLFLIPPAGQKTQTDDNSNVGKLTLSATEDIGESRVGTLTCSATGMMTQFNLPWGPPMSFSSLIREIL